MSLLSAFGFGGNSPVKKISVLEACNKLGDASAVIIDVRQPGEWQQTGVPDGAYGVSLQDPSFLQKIEKLTGGDQSKPLALFCRSGARSMQVAKKLASLGYEDVSNVEGGIMAWNMQMLPLTAKPLPVKS